MTKVEKWDVFELTLSGPESGNPFLDVALAAEFTCAGHSLRVDGFYDGAGVYKLRFMPDAEGAWSFSTTSNSPALDGIKGEFLCTSAAPANHGPVRVANQVHFAYADGTPYVPVGTTCYVWNLQAAELEKMTMRTLGSAPFNKLRFCVFPKRYAFNNNEPPSYPFAPKFAGQLYQPWSAEMVAAYRTQPPPDLWDFERFNSEYFQHLEKHILDLRARGIEADLILFHPYDYGAWGFDRMPAEVNDRYLKYLVARLASFRNLWWSFANEYDLFLDRTLADWDHSMQLVQQLDPYDHLRSIHNCFKFYDHSQSWVTHCSVQHHNLAKMPEWLSRYAKPVVVDECGYEGDIHMSWGDLSAEEMVLRFWLGFTQGGYVGHGETYFNEREELWWAKGGYLRGESVPRIAFLRQIFEQAPELAPVVKPDSESIDALEPGALARLLSPAGKQAGNIIVEGRANFEAGGYHDSDYFLFYFATHQPGRRNFNLPPGTFRIDLIDTWNMTIETFTEEASGRISVPMPGSKYMAVRIQKI